MDAKKIDDLVRSEIADDCDASNIHGVDLRNALIEPKAIRMVERLIQNGKNSDRLVDVWLVLVEHPDSRTGYRIVASRDGKRFGLATEGGASDDALVLSGWYGDFMAAFRGM